MCWVEFDSDVCQFHILFTYVACTSGINPLSPPLPSPPQRDLLERIDELNRDDTVDGLLIQLPVPAHISTDAVCNRVRPSKDVDGYTVVNLGRLHANSPLHVPATARGIRDMVEVSGVSLTEPHRLYSEGSCTCVCNCFYT